MRFLAVIGIVAFSLLAGIIVLLQQADSRKVASVPGCRNEILLLDIWKAQRLVDEIRPDGADIVVRVQTRFWLTTMRQVQVSIGKAAYCAVALAHNGGIVRVEGTNDDELGRVVDGKWSSKLFPE